MGILPINLDPAQLQKSHYTCLYIHPLIDKVENLSEHYNNLKLSLINKTSLTKQISNYDKLILYSKSIILSKICKLQINSKSKRGFINVMGSIIKSLTGNLDASAGEKIF